MPCLWMQKLTWLGGRQYKSLDKILMVANQINYISFRQSLKWKIAGGRATPRGKFQILALHLLFLAICFWPLVCVLVGLFAFPGQSTNAVPSCHKLRCGVPCSSLNWGVWHRESTRLKPHLGKISWWLTTNLVNFFLFIWLLMTGHRAKSEGLDAQLS